MSIAFDLSNSWTYATDLVNLMLPVVYVGVGLAIGFLVIREIRSAV